MIDTKYLRPTQNYVVTLSDNFISRIATIPLSQYAKFGYVSTVYLINKYLELIDEINLEKDQVCNKLYCLIPKLDKYQTRRILFLKRWIFNKLQLPHVEDVTLAKQLIKEESVVLTSYFKKIELLSTLEANLKEEYEIEKERIAGLFRDFLTDNFFQEALFLSSRNLFNDLSDFDKKSQKHKYNINCSLMNYIARACCKTTPHGLWCETCIGNWRIGHAVELQKDYSKLKRRTRLNLYYLRGALKSKQNDLDIFENLYVSVDPFCTVLENGTIVCLSKRNDNQSLLRLEAEEWILNVLEACKEGKKTISDLTEMLSLNCDIYKSEAFEAVKQLLELGLINAALEPLFGDSRVTSCLKTIRDHAIKRTMEEEFSNIQTKLDQLNYSLTWNDRKKLYVDCEKWLTSYTNKGNNPNMEKLYRVDCGGSWSKLICNDLVDPIKSSVNIYMNVVSRIYGYKDLLQDFRVRFENNFGCDRPVPLVLAERLGHPLNDVDKQWLIDEHWLAPEEEIGRLNFLRFSDYIKNKIDSMSAKQVQIELDEEELASLFDQDLNKDFPNPLAVLCQPVKNLCHLEPGQAKQDTKIVLNSISSHIGSSSTRFLNFLTDKSTIKGIFEEYFPHESDTVVRAEVVYQQFNLQDNVSEMNPALKYEIAIYGPRSARPDDKIIPIADIEIVLKGEPSKRLVVRSISKGVEIIPCVTSPLSYFHDSLVCLLSLIPLQGKIPLSSAIKSVFPWEKPNYIMPRICCGPLILSRRRWTLKKDEIKWRNLAYSDSLLMLKEATGFAKRWFLPRFIFARNDIEKKPVPIDMTNVLLLNQLGKLACDSNEYVILEEMLPNIDSNYLNFNHCNYASEFWTIFNIRKG